MVRAKGKRIVDNDDSQHFQKIEDLPEDRKRAFNSILEDFDKQVESRIEANNNLLITLEKQIRSLFRIAMLQIPRKERILKFEQQLIPHAEPRLSEQLASVKVNIESAVLNKVLENKAPKSVRNGSALKSVKKASNAIVEETPSTNVKRSTRKRVLETPAAEECTLSRRGKGLQTPASFGLPIITPKFNMATPIHRSVMRTAKANEVLVSLSGSPVYSGAVSVGRSRSKKGANDDMVPIALGSGKTLMVPTKVSDEQAQSNEPLLDLDDEDKRRLMALRSQIDNMLKIRDLN